MDPPIDTERLRTSTTNAIAALDVIIAHLDAFATDLRALERSVAAHPSAYRDDVASGEVWPDDDDLGLDDDAAADFIANIRRLPFRVTGL